MCFVNIYCLLELNIVLSIRMTDNTHRRDLRGGWGLPQHTDQVSPSRGGWGRVRVPSILITLTLVWAMHMDS